MSPSSSLVAVERTYFHYSFREGLHATLNAALSKDSHYTLFRHEDSSAWLVFTGVFLFLIAFDHWVLNRNTQALTISRAVVYTLFWVGCAMGFCWWIYWWYDANRAYMWLSGYMLEWMLSFDNLFVFHMIFSVYATPDHLKHRPLYLGICGAVFFRLLFIFIGEYLMHAMFFMHFLFGSFLIYTGVKTVTVDDDDEDPSKQPLVLWLQRKVPFVNAYDEHGAFFVRVPVDDRGNAALPDGLESRSFARTAETAPIAREDGSREARYGTIDFAAHSAARPGRGRTQLRATMLFLVVICLEISDLIFAVDSVSAIVASVNDLFLAYTSAVFAMLGLRATFFIIDVLVRLFSLLKYGVAAVLIFIGAKLCVERIYRIPPGIVCVVLVSAIASSMVASVIQDLMKDKIEGKVVKEVEERVVKVKEAFYTPPSKLRAA